MEISIRPDEDWKMYELFRMRFAADGEHYTEFTYEPDKSVVTLDRSHAGPGKTELVRKHRLRSETADGQLDVRVILDRLSTESSSMMESRSCQL